MQPRRPARHPRLNKRGVTGAIFAITTAILVGFSAIATEAALWYLGREQAYGAADAAALAGAVQYANDGSSGDAETAATTVAGLNGFGPDASGNAAAGAASSTVIANNPPLSGAYTSGTPSATEVIINVDFPTYLSSLFHAADINVGARAVAIINQPGQACLLSTSGDLTINMNIRANLCYLASNAADASAVTINDSSVNFFIKGITTEGQCSGGGCPSVNALWGDPGGDGSMVGRPTATYQMPTLNPLAGLSTSLSVSQIVCPPHTAAYFTYTDPGAAWDPTTNCPTTTMQTSVTIGSTTIPMPPTQPDTTITDPVIQPACATGTVPAGSVCAFYNMNITLGPSVFLQPGTYLLVNSNLNIPAGATVFCSAISTQGEDCHVTNRDANGNGYAGVTIILAGATGGSGGGSITIDPAATVNLSAPGTAINPTGVSGSLNGVLFYRDPSLPADTSGTSSVQIAGTSASLLEGLMYFPNANVWFAGNAGNAAPDCAIVIANTLNIGWPGNSGNTGNYVRLNDSCSAYNLFPAPSALQLPTVQAVKLVE